MSPINVRSYMISTGMMILFTIVLTGCAGNKLLVRSFPEENIVHYSQIKGWEKTKSLNNTVAYMNEGDTLPLSISMNTDFIGFEQDHIDLVAKKKLYFMIKMPENLTEEEISQINDIDMQRISQWSDAEKNAFFKKFMLYVSADAVHWAPLCNPKSLRNVFGYEKGFISFGMMANTTDGLGASFNLKTVP